MSEADQGAGPTSMAPRKGVLASESLLPFGSFFAV